jgi:hypothetical protein
LRAVLLGPVHRHVRVAEQLTRVGAGARRDADAGADEHVAPGDPERLLQRLDQLPGERDGLLRCDVGEQHGELVAAEPGRGVLRA